MAGNRQACRNVSMTAEARTHFGPDQRRSHSGGRCRPPITFDAEVSDIDYFYTSRLPGSLPPAFDDIQHPAIPRSARVGLEIWF